MVQVVAELSGNHNGSLERALKIAVAAKKAGCYALKLQTYTADSLTIDCDKPDFVINDPNSLWNGQKLYDLYKRACTPYEWHEEIFRKCEELGLVCFSAPFDLDAVDFLEALHCPIYKIASFENGYWELLEKVAQTKKPVIMSLGLLGRDEIDESVDLLRKNGCSDLTLLKCTSTYPASPKNCNLLTIEDLKKRFPQCKIGLSDHTLGIGVSLAAIALGAKLIEKHFTLDKEAGGVDEAFSMTPDEMTQLVEESKRVEEALGMVSYDLSEEEKKSKIFRRSLYIVKDIKRGEALTQDHVRVIRPCYGAKAKFYRNVLGKKVKHDLGRGDPLQLDDVE